MKPKDWKECPNAILEPLLWDLDLDYDHYESSKAEVIHQITCNADSANDYNRGLIKGRWDHMTETEFQHRLASAMNYLKSQLQNLETYT